MTIEAIKIGPEHLAEVERQVEFQLAAAKGNFVASWITCGKESRERHNASVQYKESATRLDEVAAHLKSIMENDNATS